MGISPEIYILRGSSDEVWMNGGSARPGKFYLNATTSLFSAGGGTRGAVAIGHLNDDVDVDVVVLGQSGSRVLMNSCNCGTLVRLDKWLGAWEQNPSAQANRHTWVSLADFDLDGDLDAFVVVDVSVVLFQNKFKWLTISHFTSYQHLAYMSIFIAFKRTLVAALCISTVEMDICLQVSTRTSDTTLW